MPYDPYSSTASHRFVSNCLAHVVHEDSSRSAGYRRLLDYIGVSIDTLESVIILFDFNYQPGGRNIKREEARYWEQAQRFYDIVIEQFGQHIMCDAIYMGNYLYAHVFNPRSDSDTAHPDSRTPTYSGLIEICKNIVRLAESELDAEITAAVGRQVRRSLTESAQVLIGLLRFQVFLGRRSGVVVEPDNRRSVNNLLLFPDPEIFPFLQRLCQAVSEGDEPAIGEDVERLLRLVLEKQPRSVAEFQMMFSILFTLALEALKTLNLPMADLRCIDVAELFSACKTIDEFRSALTASMISLSIRAKSGSERSIDEIVAYVRAQVEQRFTDPQLSVSQLAEEVGISQPYLSAQFRLRNGINLLDFIHRCRINCAKQLIETTDLTLQEISRRAGYGHAATMYRSFQKLENSSPGAYRNRRRSEAP